MTTNKLANNTEKVDFSDLELRINNALINASDKRFTTFSVPTPNYFNLSLGQLLTLRDQQFIEACFCTILGREADQESINYYLKKLQKGYDMRSIVVNLRYSKAGKVRFENLDHSLHSLRKYQILSLPVIGKLAVKLFRIYQSIRQIQLF